MQSLIIKNSRLVSAKITGTPAAGQEYKFQDEPDISNGQIMLYGIEAYSADQLATDLEGNTGVDATGVKSIVLQLWDVDNQKIVEIPITSLIRTNNGGLVTMLKATRIQLTKCRIRLTGTTNISQNESVSFNLYYTHA